MDDKRQWLETYIQEQIEALKSINLDVIETIIDSLKVALKDDRKIFIVGNGGSASNSSHFAVDLGKGSSDVMSKFIDRAYEVGEFKGNKRFQVISLNDNVAWMTAIGNDYSYDDIFWRQLENYASEGDILIGVSVSGKSPNVVKAFEYAKKIGMKTFAMTNWSGGDIASLADRAMKVSSPHYGRVEDAQMTALHMLCYYFMENYDFERKPSYERVKSINTGD